MCKIKLKDCLIIKTCKRKFNKSGINNGFFKNLFFEWILFLALVFLTYRIVYYVEPVKFIIERIIPSCLVKYSFLLFVLCIIILLIFVFILLINDMSYAFFIYKKYKVLIMSIIFMIGICTCEKYSSHEVIVACLILEIAIALALISLGTSKLFLYNFKANESVQSSYNERAVSGRNILTISQKKVLDQLIEVIDIRTSEDSFNIALIGAWGSGKTSVINTMIAELEERIGLSNQYDDEYLYFVLKINMQTFQSIADILDYVKEYFISLFKWYGITVYGGERSIAFLSALSEMIGNENWSRALHGLTAFEDSGFSDIEIERCFFEKKVKALLKKSKKKNIVLIVDDADRSGLEKEVMKLLAEFTSVEGIISILCLNENSDKLIRPTYDTHVINKYNSDTNEDNKLVDYFDKYIHLRLRIEESNRIEHELSVTQQILEANKRLSKRLEGKCYIKCNIKGNKKSLFDEIEYHGANPANPEEVGYRYGIYDLLTYMFLASIEELNKEQEDKKSFGQYLETIIKDYFFHCKEFEKCENLGSSFGEFEKNYINGRGNESEMNSIVMRWFATGNGSDSFGWFEQMAEHLEQIVRKLGNLCRELEWLQDSSNGKEIDVSSFEKLIEHFYKNKNFIFDNNYNQINNMDLVVIKEIIFGEEGLDLLNEALTEKEYIDAKEIIDKNISKSINLLRLLLELNSFIGYLREVLNNYRLFKMQLREAELLGMNYLDYLMKEFPCALEIKNKLNDLKINVLPESKSNSNWPDMYTFITNVIYEEYINRHAKNFCSQGNDECRAWFFDGDAQKILVMTEFKNGKRNDRCFTIDGSERIELSEKEKIKLSNLIRNNSFI